MRYILLCSLIFWTFSCSTTPTVEVQVPRDPSQDRQYFPVYQKHTSYQEVIHKFATHYTVHVTRLGPEFRTALGERYQKIFNEPQPILGEVTAKTGFFVSLFVANPEFRDLTDQNIWNIQLKTGDEISKPVLVQRLPQKEKWRPFFPGIGPWSEEYLILFDQAPGSADGPHELLHTVSSELILNSSLGRVILPW
ncbi:MAG: hypothetical protein ACOH5I_02220 [Oligoflexus sp.]